MFGKLKEKLKAVVRKITGKIEEETGVKDEHIDSKKETKKISPRKKETAKTAAAKSPKAKMAEAIVEMPVTEKADGENAIEAKEKPKGLFAKITEKFTHKELSEEFLANVLWELEVTLLENN